MPISEQKKTEVNLKRLLQLCEQTVQNDNSPDAAWRTDPRFRNHVGTAQSLISTLEASGSGESSWLLEGHRRQAAALAAELKPERAPTTSAREPPKPLVADGWLEDQSAGIAQMSGSSAPSAPRRRVAPVLQARRGDLTVLSGSAQAIVQRHRDLQEGLTDELVELAAGLRGHALQMQHNVAESSRVLDSIEGTVGKNLSRAQRASHRAKEMYDIQRQGFCQTCLVLLLVGVMFIFTYGLIRISSDKVRVQALQ